jgi:hypothetical protein
VDGHATRAMKQTFLAS